MYLSTTTVIVSLAVGLISANVSDEDKCPSIVPRKDWNASDPIEVKPLAIIPSPFVVVHHSAVPSCFTVDDCKKSVKSVQNYHMIDKGWEDIGYNFLIGGDGTIFEGRGWGIHGAHVIKYNARSIGICLLGNFQEIAPPNIQVKALNDLIACGKDTGQITEDYSLIGHRQGFATLCPGDFLFKLVESMPHFNPKPH